jgi:hypothetical protein
MSRIFFLTLGLTLIFFGQIYGQGAKKGLDFIIIINDNIVVGSIASLRIELISEKTKENITANYYPGNLSLTENEYGKLMSDSIKTINLKFIYYEYVGEKQNTYNYNIELKREWLKDYFNILRVYDLSKKAYKGRYNPCGVGKNYAYEIESPSHSFRLIEKKN